MRGTHARRVEAEILHDARPHVLHQHVALPDVSLEPFDCCGVAQIEREAALVIIHAVERVGSIGREQRAPVARVIASFRPLELDYVGAQIGEDASRERAREILADLDHFDAGQGQHDLVPFGVIPAERPGSGPGASSAREPESMTTERAASHDPWSWIPARAGTTRSNSYLRPSRLRATTQRCTSEGPS
jgi:hypothetical protein